MNPADPSGRSPHGPRALHFALLAAVAAFAWLRFSDNTVDNDLWGHVLYGQRAWLRGGIEFTETLSWTAAGKPWINHEFVAELVMGAVHRAAGGTGLWLLMVGCACLTVGLALREGRGTSPRQGWSALGLFAVSINMIATGYAVRPQLFTLLALVLLVGVLRRLDRGSRAWAFAVPVLFAVWANTHGGYLAGMVVVASAAAAWTAHTGLAARPTSERAAWLLLPAAALVGALCNPWGWHLVEWTAASVLLPRPSIGEWHPLGFSDRGLALLAVMLVSLLGWGFSREPRRWWEAAVLVVLAAMALRSQRHTPLFGLANLILSPVHLASAAGRFTPHCRSLATAVGHPAFHWPVAALLAAAAVLTVRTSVSEPRMHPFTLEVERSVFPEAAVAHMAEHGLTGNTVTFFDWGQHVLWRLPDNPVSFDGRLDTVFPVPVMDAHWRLFDGKEPGPPLDLARAEVALLPVFSPGADWLRDRGWTTVYRDGLAEVLVQHPARYPALRGRRLPVMAKLAVTAGRSPFPDDVPVLATPAAPR